MWMSVCCCLGRGVVRVLCNEGIVFWYGVY